MPVDIDMRGIDAVLGREFASCCAPARTRRWERSPDLVEESGLKIERQLMRRLVAE